MAKNNISVDAMMDLSLDDYIQMKNIKHPEISGHKMVRSFHKFDRYRDAEDTESEDEDVQMSHVHNLLAAKEIKMEKPAEPVVSAAPEVTITLTKPKVNHVWDNIPLDNYISSKNRGPVHNRLGNRNNNVGRQRQNHNPYYKNNMEANRVRNLQLSVQNRLQKDYVDPKLLLANISQASNQIQSAVKDLRTKSSEMAQTILEEVKIQQEKRDQGLLYKYDMAIQKDISVLQSKPLFYSCPGKMVVSSDGPGLKDARFQIPQNVTGMTLNQRFA